MTAISPKLVTSAMGVAVGNKVTFEAVSMTGDSGVVVGGAASAVKMGMRIVGDIHGFLRFPFADPETLEGALTPNDLATAQIKLTQGGADGVLALICEEVYGI